KTVHMTKTEVGKGASDLLLTALEPVARVPWRYGLLGALDYDESDPRQRRPGDEEPTFEHIGQLFSFVRDLQRSQEELAGYVNRIEKGLDDLDHTRLQESD